MVHCQWSIDKQVATVAPAQCRLAYSRPHDQTTLWQNDNPDYATERKEQLTFLAALRTHQNTNDRWLQQAQPTVGKLWTGETHKNARPRL